VRLREHRHEGDALGLERRALRLGEQRVAGLERLPRRLPLQHAQPLARASHEHRERRVRLAELAGRAGLAQPREEHQGVRVGLGRHARLVVVRGDLAGRVRRPLLERLGHLLVDAPHTARVRGAAHRVDEERVGEGEAVAVARPVRL
jgi:hypothetical protein